MQKLKRKINVPLIGIFFQFINKKVKAGHRLGFTLIEALIVVFIFSIITLSFYSSMSLGARYIIKSKNNLEAVALAREKMEIVRNLKYDDIGTINGIPNGTIADDEDVLVNGRAYHVRTLVKFDDDAFDGIFPADTVSNDYKQVRVMVSWQGDVSANNSVSLTSRFVPPGLEVGTGDGVLAINIINGAGEGISQAAVHIVNNSISPAVNISTQTDNNGNIMFPGAKQSIQKYKVTVSKDNYETVETIDPISVPYNPTDVNASVIKDLLNIKVIIINLLANLEISSIDFSNNPLPNVNFNIEGGRILGTDNETPPNNIYNINSDSSTNANGEKIFNDISPGQFTLSSIEDIDGYAFIGMDPASPFVVVPGETKEVKIKFVDENVDSLLVKVMRNDDSTFIKDAQVRLTNSDGYDTTITTLSDGVAFFPVTGNSLVAGNYTLEITAVGYQSYTGSVDVNKFTEREVKLTAI